MQLRTFSLLLRWNSLLCSLVADPWTTWKRLLPLVSNLYIPSDRESCWGTWKVRGGREQKGRNRIQADAAEAEEWDTHLACRREKWDSKGAKLSDLGRFARLSAAKYNDRARQAAPSPMFSFPRPSFQSQMFSPSALIFKCSIWKKNGQSRILKTNVCLVGFTSSPLIIPTAFQPAPFIQD